MKHDAIFSSTTRPQGTLAQWRDYWAEYPDRFSRALRPPARQSAAAEVFPHLNRLDSALTASAVATSAPRLRTVEGVKSSGAGPAPSSHSPGERGLFVDPAQQERGAVSPLEALYPGGVARPEQKR